MDVQQVKRAKKGDTESFTQLVLEIKDQAYRIAYSYLQNEQDSMDAVCDAMEKAYKNLRKLRDDSLFKTWFIRIVINEAKLQLGKRKQAILAADRLFSRQTSEDHESLEERMDLQQILRQMDRTERLIIYLKYFAGYTLEEIADLVNMPVGTVKTRLYGNLKAIRAKLNYREV
ncbi:MAG TPA: sigma-70 family RNA polymerase sigma factor [Candidatus Atribacteria bacterium]|nr:sigma-70 family RNA polymerase sigma factor [Candidatus Atribacteria bacterium]